jgi:hypothetical protein
MSRCNRLSENGKPFCLSSIHLSISTTLSDTKLRNRAAIIKMEVTFAEKRELSVTKAVLNTIKRVYKVVENIYDADHKAIEDIKTFSVSVVIQKASVYT